MFVALIKTFVFHQYLIICRWTIKWISLAEKYQLKRVRKNEYLLDIVYVPHSIIHSNLCIYQNMMPVIWQAGRKVDIV